MAVVVRLPKITKEQYEQISAKLTPTSPPGLLVHVSFSEGDSVEGFQVWESEEVWGADMARVLPVLTEAGVSTERPPTAMPVLAIEGSKLQK